MKIITYLNENLTSKILPFFELCLLSKDYAIESRNPDELNNFREGYLGVVPRKLLKDYNESDKTVILIDQKLTKGNFHWEQTKLIISINDVNTDLPIELISAIYIDKFFLKDFLDCNNNECCFFHDGDNFGQRICSKCQENFVAQHKIDHALRLIVNISLSKLSSSDFRSMTQVEFGQIVKNLRLKLDDPHLMIHATNVTLDTIFTHSSTIRKWLSSSAIEIHDEKEKLKNDYGSSSVSFPKVPTMIVGRRWNSWTPTQPTSDILMVGNKMGGGYLISNGEVKIAVDPGYGFLSMLYCFHDITVMDIDAIIITHDHPDHSSELSNFLSLRFVYNQENPLPPLTILLNPSCYYLYERTLMYYSGLVDWETTRVLRPDETHDFGGIVVHSIEMLHNEIYHMLDEDKQEKVKEVVGESHTLGLKFNGKSPEGENFTFVILGDTSFPDTNADINRIYAFFSKADIAAIHLGSLEKKWRNNTVDNASEIAYGRRAHLGLNGAVKMINMINPKLTLLTEFGEELSPKDFRLSITDVIKDSLFNRESEVIASDIPLYVIFYKGKILCKCKCGKGFIPIDKVSIERNSEYNLLYYAYPSGCLSELEHIKFSEE